MEVRNFNTVVVSLSDHDAWMLSQILTKLPDYFSNKDDPFVKFAKQLNEGLEKHSKGDL